MLSSLRFILWCALCKEHSPCSFICYSRNERFNRLRAMRWGLGAVLPDEVQQCTSEQEVCASMCVSVCVSASVCLCLVSVCACAWLCMCVYLSVARTHAGTPHLLPFSSFMLLCAGSLLACCCSVLQCASTTSSSAATWLTSTLTSPA